MQLKDLKTNALRVKILEPLDVTLPLLLLPLSLV